MLTQCLQRRKGNPGVLVVPLWKWFVAVACICTVRSAVAAEKRAPALDGNAIVHKMVATYQHAESVQETTEAKIVQLGGAVVLQTTTLKYEKPNKIYISSEDPAYGTMAGYSDGSKIAIFSGKQNIYTRRTAPDTIAGVLKVFRTASQASLGLPLDEVLSPATFLAAHGMPDEAKSFHYVKTMTVDGKTAYRVDGVADASFVKGLAPDLTIQPLQNTVILFIDAKTSLLLRAIIALKWLSTRPGEPKTHKPRYSGGFAFEEVHRNIQLNAPVDESVFRFIPPHGALEKFQTRGGP